MDRLITWGISVDARCRLCQSGQDNHSHLFFDYCPSSRGVRANLMSRFQYDHDCVDLELEINSGKDS